MSPEICPNGFYTALFQCDQPFQGSVDLGKELKYHLVEFVGLLPEKDVSAIYYHEYGTRDSSMKLLGKVRWCQDIFPADQYKGRDGNRADLG